MNEKVVILPNREEMLKRLKRVSDGVHIQEKFYPILLKSAGKKLIAEGIAMMFTLAIHDYVKNDPPAIASMMYELVPQFITALVDDREVAEQAKIFLQEVLGKA